MSHQTVGKIRHFIEKHELIKKGDHLVIGVSGGADSMMLLHFLYTHKEYYKVDLKVAHVHHGIREEAEEDAKLVKDTCGSWKIPYYRHDCNIKALAKERGLSEEETGRQERYTFFISLTNDNGKIVTAHHMNDQAETLIMRFLRGADINGLGGISPKRDGVIRPLLGIERKEIENYCKENHIIYRDDHTNFMPIYTRNRIRLEAIPYIQENINPNIIQMLAEHSDNYRESENFLKAYTKDMFECCAKEEDNGLIIEVETFKAYPAIIQKRVLLYAIEKLIPHRKNITSKHINSIANLSLAQTGKRVDLPYGLIAIRQYNEIILKKEKVEHHQVGYNYQLELGENVIPEINAIITLTKVKKETIEQKNEKMYTKYIDYGKIENGLQIRTRQPKDYIRTKEGTKKIKKLFIEDKIPSQLRDTISLIADGHEIIWVVAGRLNSHYYITEDTIQVLEIKLQAE